VKKQDPKSRGCQDRLKKSRAKPTSKTEKRTNSTRKNHLGQIHDGHFKHRGEKRGTFHRNDDSRRRKSVCSSSTLKGVGEITQKDQTHHREGTDPVPGITRGEEYGAVRGSDPVRWNKQGKGSRTHGGGGDRGGSLGGQATRLYRLGRRTPKEGRQKDG